MSHFITLNYACTLLYSILSKRCNVYVHAQCHTLCTEFFLLFVNFVLFVQCAFYVLYVCVFFLCAHAQGCLAMNE